MGYSVLRSRRGCGFHRCGRFRGKLMKHFTHFKDFSPAEINALIDAALAIKQHRLRPNLKERVLGMLFFNPSLRTRISFETAMQRFGGHAISLAAGSEEWTLEYEEHAVMNGNSVKHLKD